MKNRTMTDITKDKISKSLIGNNRAKGNKNWVGKKHSDESKKKMSETMKEKAKGRKHSEETRSKMSESAKKRTKFHR